MSETPPPAQPPDAGQPEARAVPGVTREQVRQIISDAIEKAWWSPGTPASEKVMEAIWPLLERAEAAEAKLAEIRGLAQDVEGRHDRLPVVPAKNILAITGSEEESRER